MFDSSLEDDIDIRILPLIDVIFFLLIFFMMFTTFRSSPEGIDINLPQAQTATEQEESPVTVNISEEGQVYIDDELIRVDDLAEEIEVVIEEKSSETLFVINADQEVAYEQLIRIIDELRRAGGHRLALATDRENGN